MGMEKRRAEEKSGQKRRRTSQGKGGRANWMLVSADDIQYVIAALAQDGGAVRFGYTRDGGAYAIGIYGDGEPYTEYVSPNEDMHEYLGNIAKDFGNITGDGSYVGADEER